MKRRANGLTPKGYGIAGRDEVFVAMTSLTAESGLCTTESKAMSIARPKILTALLLAASAAALSGCVATGGYDPYYPAYGETVVVPPPAVYAAPPPVFVQPGYRYRSWDDDRGWRGRGWDNRRDWSNRGDRGHRGDRGNRGDWSNRGNWGNQGGGNHNGDPHAWERPGGPHGWGR